MLDGFWVLANRRVWDKISADLRDILERNIDEEALRWRTEVECMNADLQSKGLLIAPPVYGRRARLDRCSLKHGPLPVCINKRSARLSQNTAPIDEKLP